MKWVIVSAGLLCWFLVQVWFGRKLQGFVDDAEKAIEREKAAHEETC